MAHLISPSTIADGVSYRINFRGPPLIDRDGLGRWSHPFLNLRNSPLPYRFLRSQTLADLELDGWDQSPLFFNILQWVR